jgi:hypothetical protein
MNPSTEYTYRVRAYYEQTTSAPSNEVTEKTFDDPSDISNDKELNNPSDFALNQNFPNPFNPTTAINFNLPVTTNVSLKIYNLHGQLIATLIDKSLPAGFYRFNWQPEEIGSGIYFYQLKTEGFMETKKMIYQK